MNGCEWIRNTLRHEECEAIPYNFMFSPPAQKAAEERYGTPLEKTLTLPVPMTGLKSIKPLYAPPGQYGPTIQDEFGVTWSTNDIDRGSPIGPCISEATLKDYTFPEASVAYRFENIEAWCKEQEGGFRVIWVGDLWERATFMRGMEHILMDILLNRGFVEGLLTGIADRILETMEILLERHSFEGIALSDDYGTQNGMMMSPQDWRELILPHLKRIYGLAKKHGRATFHHSCGNFVPVIPDMIEAGLDILHPIQPEANDILMLKREFGRDLSFCGGIPTQNLLVKGTPQAVQEEVKRLKREMGKNGGFILEPGITIQADVPHENLFAMIDEARAVNS